ncbi:MAG: hypothetical protein V3U96_01545 [Paracoccaceae bacterium]
MEQIGDRRWHDSHEHFRYDNILNGDCAAQKGVVCFDALQPHDQIHAQRMLRETKGLCFECPGTWHFAAKLLQKEIGIMGFLKNIAEIIKQGQDVDRYVSDVKNNVGACFAVRFLNASGEGKIQLLEEFGLDILQQDIHLNALARAFGLEPSKELAAIIFLGAVLDT